MKPGVTDKTMKTIALNLSALLLMLTLLSGCVGYVPASTSVGVTVGPRPYGYYGYGYNPYYRPYYRRPPVIVRPRYHYRAPNPRFYGGGRGYGRGRRW